MTRTSTLALALATAALAACGDPTITRVEPADFGFDGTCVRCHAGLHAGQVHPTFKLRCVDCHGGNDQIEDVPANAFQDTANYRNPALIAASHVPLKSDALARFFFANGVDDDGDGLVDEGPTFDDVNGNFKLDPGETVSDPGEIAELGVQGEWVGQFIDSELNRDLNYTRWLNPGDLRVATASCGAGSSQGNAAGGCHQNVIDINRRSIMVNQSAVINGAYYGNESWRQAFIDARDELGAARDPRKGAFGFSLAWKAIDDCIVKDDQNQPSFDSACLEAAAAANDPNAAAGAPGNAGLPAFEATQGVMEPVAPAGQTQPQGVERETARYPWGGHALGPATDPLAQMRPVPDEELAPGIPDPVDNILRGFRAYYPLNFPGSGNNFAFSFGESILPNFDLLVFNNPFGRGHSSGCTGCHMAYARDGARQPQRVPQLVDGQLSFGEVADPTTKHREFDPEAQDIVDIGGERRLVGVAVNLAEREATGREQQRFYSESHALTTKITTDTCGLCHTFVTRIDHSYRGMAEDEQRDAIARQKPISFATPAGTKVNILSSHVREEGPANARVLVEPEGLPVIAAAKQRDKELAALGLLPSHGGCVTDVFTEDCNNNGELDTSLTLAGVDPRTGKAVSTTINEDQNANGELDLIDRVPRERSVDGRQFKYVYGGANGSTRLMDIHFEKGMHCIDCHFLQDSHGDGQIYATNWEAIEIECEDCHGTLGQRATLVTSGENGGNDLTTARDERGLPYFIKMPDGTVFQRSRVEPGLAWKVPQVDDVLDPSKPEFNARAVPAMGLAAHMPPGVPAGGKTSAAGSRFDAAGKLEHATMECYTCHNAWTYNCMGCHYQMNLGDDVRTKIDAAGVLTAVAGENEVWFNNKPQAAKTDFQLLGLHRGPFVLGLNASADGSRLAPFRSSMLTHVSVDDAAGNTLFDNVTFTTWQAKDANSGRANVATSGAALNQTMPHSVRPLETKDCDWCHAVVDQAGRIRNDHVLAQTFGLGAGRYPYAGDWILAASTGGLEIYDVKDDNELKGSSGSNRFPGLIVSAQDRVAAKVEPILDGALGLSNATFDGTDVALIRNFNPAPAAPGMTAAPTLRDLAIYTLAGGGDGKVVIADVTGRGHPTSARPSVGATASVFVLDLAQPAFALATLSPDVSDPYVYVANGTAGLTTVELLAAPATGVTAAQSTSVGDGSDARAVALAGDAIYTGTQDGQIVVHDARQSPESPVVLDKVAVGGAVRAMTVSGFFLYVATDQGLAVLDIADPFAPAVPAGATSALVLPGLDARGVAVWGHHAFVAAGTGGLVDVDVSVPAAPVDAAVSLPAGESLDARDVIVSVVPGQVWLHVADAGSGGRLVALKLDTTRNPRERCFPDPAAAGCSLDLDFRDPTIMGRDPGFDPVAGAFKDAAVDPSGPPFLAFAAQNGAPTRLADPAIWEKMGTLTGRRMRDSFMPGSGVLSLEVMQKLRKVELCEVPNTPDVDGNGLGSLGFADDAFRSTGVCQPM